MADYAIRVRKRINKMRQFNHTIVVVSKIYSSKLSEQGWYEASLLIPPYDLI